MSVNRDLILKNAAGARAAYARKLQAQREHDAPRVREAHDHGLLVHVICRKTSLSPRYVRKLLLAMGLKPHADPHGRGRKPDAVKPPRDDKIQDYSQQRFWRGVRLACGDHFRDLANAYPGRKLASLALAESPAPRLIRASSSVGYGSPAASCAEAAIAGARSGL